MAEYTVDDFKKQYPNGVVVDLKEWDEHKQNFDNKLVLFTYSFFSIALVNYAKIKEKKNFFHSSTYFVNLLYNNQEKVMWLTWMEVLKQIWNPIKELRKLAFKLRDAIADVYPQKQTSYKFESALTKIDFDILADILPDYAYKAKLNPRFTSSGLIEEVEIYIDIQASPEVITESLRNRIISGEVLKNNSSEEKPKFYHALLEGFPEEAKVFRIIPRKTVADYFHYDNSLLITLAFYVKSIHWLYKLSATTLTIPSDPKFNEIHVILVDFAYFITTGRNRHINDITFPHTYQYGISRYNEEKFLTYLDKIIPYQTVFILKVSGYKSTEYYQIWSGIKDITAKGMTVKQYYHSEWISVHRYSNTESSAKNPFTLSLEGNDLKNVMYNFIDQLIGKKKTTPKTESTKKHLNQISTEKQNESTAPVKKEKPSLSRFDTPDTISNRKKMLMHTHILEKLEDFLKNNFDKTYYDFEISRYFSPKTIEDFKKTETKIMLDGMGEQKTLSAYDVEIAACKEMARLLANYFNFEFSADNDVITITKKIRTDFTKAMLIHEIGKFYIFS